MEQVCDDLLYHSVKRVRRDGLVDQPDSERLIHAEGSCQEHPRLCLAGADGRDDMRRDGRRGQSQACLAEREPGSLRRDHDVGGAHQTHPPAEGGPVDAGDDRNRAARDRRQEIGDPFRVGAGLAVLGTLDKLGDVTAGAEDGTVAGEDDYPRLAALRDGRKGATKGGHEGAGQRIASSWAGQGDAQDWSVLPDRQFVVRSLLLHRAVLLLRAGACRSGCCRPHLVRLVQPSRRECLAEVHVSDHTLDPTVANPKG